MTEEQLSALLRLKRYENPGPEYFDRLLQDVHRRQRAELLRRPLWRIAADRFQTFFSEHSMGPVAYAGAMASALILGVGLIGLMNPGDLETRRPVSRTIAASATPVLTLQPASPRRPSLVAQPFETTQQARSARHVPRYVIDARPVSYEGPFKF